HVRTRSDQLVRERGEPVQSAVSQTCFQHEVLPFDVAELTQPLAERLKDAAGGREIAHPEYFAHQLRLRGERRGEEPGDTSNERAAVHHSITLSARSRSAGGIVSPRALAVLRLMTRSNLVGCSTGRS